MVTERTERMRSEFRFMLRSGASASAVEEWAEGHDLTRRDLIDMLLCDDNEEQARAERIADGLGGTAFTDDGVWLVRIEREDGKLVIVGDDVTLHADECAVEHGNDEQSIALR